LKTWVEAGQDPSLFWRLTYREIDVILAGVSERLKREHNERAWLAWHTAMIGRVKRPPKLKDMMHGAARPRRRQTIEEQIAIAKQWTVAIARAR